VKKRVILICLLSLAMTGTLSAQEAESGFELNSTVSGEALYSPQLSIPSRDNVPAMGAFRVVLIQLGSSASIGRYSAPCKPIPGPISMRISQPRDHSLKRTFCKPM
jgi:hypothetical protein